MVEQATTEVESTYRPIHPALRRKVQAKRSDAKQRRTIVRTAKMVNAANPDSPSLVQVPIEPGHNNKGILTDPSMPMRYYLDKGFTFPYETPEAILKKLPKGSQRATLYCAVENCWEDAVAASNPSGSERCPTHDAQYGGEIRYATSAREYRE